MATLYLAHFSTSSVEFYTAALSWPVQMGPILGGNWWRILQSRTDVDVGLRVTAGNQPSVLLLLTADKRQTLQSLVNALRATKLIPGLKQPVSAREYNAITDLAKLREHLRTHYEGYYGGGQPLACNFRLYAVWAGQGLDNEVGYQIGLRAHPTEPERERRVRKYLAWLELEQPFTPSVRELQKILCRRLLSPSWFANEYMLFSNIEHLRSWEEKISTHFVETTGRIGFSEAPIEAGDFSDWLTTGCHTLRYEDTPSSVPVEAAYAFSNDEIVWLLQQNLVVPSQSTLESQPKVFISYSSADFAYADKMRQYLEIKGRRCWLAPRDINTSGLPYTEAIPRAIKQVRAVVVLLSPSANLSVHIPREIDLALEQKLPVVPLRVHNILPAGQLKYLLQTCQWLDLFDRDHTEVMRELDNRLESIGV
jgi:hypothetical protein